MSDESSKNSPRLPRLPSLTSSDSSLAPIRGRSTSPEQEKHLPHLEELLEKLQPISSPSLSRSWSDEQAILAAKRLQLLTASRARPTPTGSRHPQPRATGQSTTHQNLPLPSSSAQPPKKASAALSFPGPLNRDALMAWQSLNLLPALNAPSPDWTQSILGSATAHELAQAQAELDAWSTISFADDNNSPFSFSPHCDEPKEDHFGLFGHLGAGSWADHKREKDLHADELGLYDQLHSAQDVASFDASGLATAASRLSSSSAPAPVPSVAPAAINSSATSRKRSIDTLAESAPSPPQSDSASGESSSAPSGPLSEGEKRRRNTEASARFRAKKRQRELELRESTSQLQDKVNNLEKIAESLRAENRFLRGIVADKHAR